MAIYARRSGSTDLAGVLNDVVVEKTPLNGWLLIWNEKQQAFVVSPPPDSLSYVNATKTFGGLNTHTVDAGISGNVLQFKQVKAGSGIDIYSDENSITINSNLKDRQSFKEGYKLIIDNNRTSNNAKFEIWTAYSSTGWPISASIIPPIIPITVQYLYAENENGKGIFKTINGFDFLAEGFAAGMFLVIDGAGNQSGEWIINSVFNRTVLAGIESVIELTEEFTGYFAFNLGGPKSNTQITTIDLYIPKQLGQAYQLQSYSLDFGPAGYNFTPNTIISIAGSRGIDGSYTIESVLPKGAGPFDYSTLTFTSNYPLPITGMVQDVTPVSPSLILSAGLQEGPTGFYVSQDGTVRSKSVYIDNPAITFDSAVRKDYVDSRLVSNANAYFLSFF